MFSLITLELEQSRVEPYKKYVSTNASFLDVKAYTAISPDKLEEYLTDLEKLFIRYNVKEEHYECLLFILGQHYFIYEIINEKKVDASECFEPLKFLRDYQKQTQDIVKLSKNETSLKSQLSSRFIEVVAPTFKSQSPVTLTNADFVVKSIYQLFKKQYQFSLRELLQPYDELPPLETLNELVNEIDYILNHASQYFIAEIAIDLLDYMDRYMQGELSRKHYLFISDFLILSGTFSLTDNEEESEFELTDTFAKENLNNLSKTACLKRVIKNYRKFSKNNP